MNLCLVALTLLMVSSVHCYHVSTMVEKKVQDLLEESSHDVIDTEDAVAVGGADQLARILSRDRREGEVCKLVLYRANHMQYGAFRRVTRKYATIKKNRVKSIRVIGDCCWKLSNKHRVSSVKIGGKYGMEFQSPMGIGLRKGLPYVKYIKRLNSCD